MGYTQHMVYVPVGINSRHLTNENPIQKIDKNNQNKKQMTHKGLFTRKLQRYYLQPRVFKVNMQVRIYEKYVLLDEVVVAHSQKQAYRKATDKIKENIEISGVGSKVVGKTENFKNIKV